MYYLPHIYHCRWCTEVSFVQMFLYHHSSEMELSPAQSEQRAEGDSLLSIARRIAEGLHPCMVYSDTDYLNNVKAELRKLLKQGLTVCDVNVRCSLRVHCMLLAVVLICCVFVAFFAG